MSYFALNKGVESSSRLTLRGKSFLQGVWTSVWHRAFRKIIVRDIYLLHENIISFNFPIHKIIYVKKLHKIFQYIISFNATINLILKKLKEGI